ncbi:FecCD family ABC transporter permease [Staphylospora marina]|uniref:FecCD family ABC transporter permease n=1 Tax=Staphylospora marina TaxID=2490858 RepID=UPI000F5BA056|nr:iron ABC transporter permease [Staphylospora marina]
MMDVRPEIIRKTRWILLGALLVLIALFVTSVATGSVSLSPSQLWRTVLGQGTMKENLVLFEFRLPRIMISMLAGAGLAVAGSILQSVTRNPLADPGILGINAGAGLSVVLFVMFFRADHSLFQFGLPFFALTGGLGAALLIHVFAWRKGEGAEPNRLVLVGVGIAAALNGAVLLLSIRMDPEDYDFFANWLAGRIWGDDWPYVVALLPWIVLLVPVVFAKSRVLNVLNLHEHVSVGLGVRVKRERFILIFLAVALASSSVSVSGGIPFVGLLAPHMARSLVGPRHQGFLPLAAVLGAILVLAADTTGRVLLDPSGIPAGIIVTLIGAPYFMWLMARQPGR